MAFNKNELILDRVRYVTARDLSTDEMLFRLSSVEEPSLNCTAEGEEVVDAIGALITTMYRAKRATFSGTNSLISLDLAAAQYGTRKQIGSEKAKITTRNFEVINVAKGTTDVTLKHAPVGKVNYIYEMHDGDPATAYAAGAAASATEFVQGENGVLTMPTDFVGKIYVEYDYETENAVRVDNAASNFPEACKLAIFAYFRDKCNENIVYSGVILCPKAKTNPESIELALTATGKHAFEFVINKDFCAEEGEDMLFSIIVAQQ